MEQPSSLLSEALESGWYPPMLLLLDRTLFVQPYFNTIVLASITLSQGNLPNNSKDRVQGSDDRLHC